MDFQKGERVLLNFDTGAVERADSGPSREAAAPSIPSFVGDILEHDSSTTDPPVAPSLNTNVNAFQHTRSGFQGYLHSNISVRPMNSMLLRLPKRTMLRGLSWIQTRRGEL